MKIWKKLWIRNNKKGLENFQSFLFFIFSQKTCGFILRKKYSEKACKLRKVKILGFDKRFSKPAKNKGSKDYYCNSNNSSLLPVLFFHRICCKLENLYCWQESAKDYWEGKWRINENHFIFLFHPWKF